MPKPKSHSRDDLIDKAMLLFWSKGFEATSMEDLVKATGVSRYGIYEEASGKEGLFLSCLEAYSQNIVTPAFARVEHPDAGLQAIADYFEYQINAGESAGLPGPGCLMANSMTEVAPQNATVAKRVAGHNARLLAGFTAALSNGVESSSRQIKADEIAQLAQMLVAFANGLWSMSRTVDSAEPLRGAVGAIMKLLHGRLRHD
jgi:TetR/AcrR family transcriptional regulator, transcriptional repressor for nem operon